jgi:hypothetical protein
MKVEANIDVKEKSQSFGAWVRKMHHISKICVQESSVWVLYCFIFNSDFIIALK